MFQCRSFRPLTGWVPLTMMAHDGPMVPNIWTLAIILHKVSEYIAVYVC